MKSEAKIFISYAKEDYEIAKKLYDDLKKTDVEPWLDDEDHLPGQNWKLAIKKAIKSSSYCLVVVDERYSASEMNGWASTATCLTIHSCEMTSIRA